MTAQRADAAGVLVTGAGGFIGSGLCTTARARGARIVRLVRRPQPAEPDRMTRVADLGAESDWPALLDGIGAIVHLAGPAHVPFGSDAAALAQLRRVNVEGTARLARAAAAAGVRRLVFVSTIKVNGETTPAQPFTERDAPDPRDAYAVSKWEAEQALAEVAAGSRLEIVVLRPPLVYGPGVKANFLALLRAVDRGWPLPLGAIDNRRSLVYLDNLIDAILLCLEHPAAAGKTYLVSDGEDISTPELVRKLAHALDRPARLFPVPVALLRAAGAITGRRDAVERLTGSLQIDGSAIRRELGWRPPATLHEGFAATARGYRAQSIDAMRVKPG
ncbi:MAG TPA: NAD-dependent epimerase/dehydratase family protein [Burkholderiales bacterium]|nr:NAD-dependent epimerase/dehydratase family protein [Burkholderiales bacterium]